MVIIEPGYIAPGMKHDDDHPGPAVYAELHAQWGATAATLTGPGGPAGTRAGGASRWPTPWRTRRTPLRVEVGDDAAMVLQLRRTLDDAEFEATMRDALGLTW